MLHDKIYQIILTTNLLKRYQCIANVSSNVMEEVLTAYLWRCHGSYSYKLATLKRKMRRSELNKMTELMCIPFICKDQGATEIPISNFMSLSFTDYWHQMTPGVPPNTSVGILMILLFHSKESQWSAQGNSRGHLIYAPSNLYYITNPWCLYAQYGSSAMLFIGTVLYSS
jgi:hypothetical protein